MVDILKSNVLALTMVSNETKTIKISALQLSQFVKTVLIYL